MTEHEKLALLYIINKTQDTLQYAIAEEDKISDNDAIAYFKIKSCLQGLIQEYIKEVESKGCEVIWEGCKAVKIVEKGEKEPCEDCVKREDIIQHICESNECYKADCKGRLYKRCWDLEWIYDLPSVKPARKRGKWIKYGPRRAGEQHYQCTHCKEYVNFGMWGSYYTKDFKYCPHCGAEME